MDCLEVAEGVIRVVNASMVKGIRFVSVEKGHDPRDFALVCFGGNGPLHAVELARELGISRVMIPFAPGVNCAYGLLVADFRYDYSTTYLRRLAEVDLEEISAAYGEVEASSRQKLADDGIPPGDIATSRALDLRYVGQGHELEVPLAGGTITDESLAAAARRFNELHQQQFGYSVDGEEIEIVNLRLGCLGAVPKPEIRQHPLGDESAEPAAKGVRDAYITGRLHRTPVYDRELLEPGNRIEGPALIEQKDSTTLLLPDSRGRIDGCRNIIIQC
jgi:N-methylhydantoinase A